MANQTLPLFEAMPDPDTSDPRAIDLDTPSLRQVERLAREFASRFDGTPLPALEIPAHQRKELRSFLAGELSRSKSYTNGYEPGEELPAPPPIQADWASWGENHKGDYRPPRFDLDESQAERVKELLAAGATWLSVRDAMGLAISPETLNQAAGRLGILKPKRRRAT